MYPNLRAEMARYNIDGIKLSILLGCSPKTVSAKLTGKVDFTRREIFKIQKELFPNHSLEYLFSSETIKTA